MATLIFHGQFHDGDGLGLAALTVTCDVYRTALADGATSQVVTAGSASETGGGIYRYLLASADPTLYHYVANLKTTDTDAVQRHVAALGLVVPDAQVSAASWDAARSGHAGAGTFGATAEWAGSVDTNAIATAAAYAVWNENMADHLGPTSTGGRLDMASRAAPVGDMIEAVGYQRFKITALENMPAAVGLATANLDAQLAGLPTAAAAAILAAADSDPISANVTYSAGVALAGRLAEYADVSPLALEATAQAVLADTGTTLPALIGGLSGATVTVVSSVDGGTVTVYAADTWRFTVASDELHLADYETVALVVKRNARQADTQALLYVRSDTGLVRMDGSAPASAGNGTLTKTASSFTAVVHVAETQGLTPGGYRWWLKGLDTTPAPDEAVTLATGEFVVLAAGLQAVV